MWPNGWGMMYGWGMPWGTMWMWLPVVIVVGVGIWLLLRALSSSKKTNPMDILLDRYARGEITKEQFDQMKKDLS